MSVLLGLWSQKQCTLEHRVEQLYTSSKTDWLLSAFPQAKDCLSTLQGPQDKAAGSVPHGFSEPARREDFPGAWIWWWSGRGGLWGRILSKWQLSMHIFRGQEWVLLVLPFLSFCLGVILAINLTWTVLVSHISFTWSSCPFLQSAIVRNR